MRWSMKAVSLALLALAAALAACGKRGPQYDVNLLKNSSFENIAADGIPEGWTLEPFRGDENQSEVQYGVDGDIHTDGQKAWYFRGDPGTRRWYMLSQEVPVAEGSTHIRIQGWIQTDGTRMGGDQFMQANYLLTFYDEKHQRFHAERIADQRTPFRHGTNPWMEENQQYRLPPGTRFVKVSCVLGANGQVWFDKVSLSVPTPIDWETSTTKNFVFHWLPGHPMPEGAPQAQQQIFDYISSRLDLKSDLVIGYYFYPDTATIRQMLDIQGYQQVNWENAEIHSINGNDNHEIVHLMTDKIGRPPRVIAEGTVYWLQEEWNGKSIEDCMRELASKNSIPMLASLFDTAVFARADPNITMPAAASFVGFLVKRWGPGNLIGLYTALDGARDFESVGPAFEKIYGLPMPKIEDAWHAALLAELGSPAGAR